MDTIDFLYNEMESFRTVGNKDNLEALRNCIGLTEEELLDAADYRNTGPISQKRYKKWLKAHSGEPTQDRVPMPKFPEEMDYKYIPYWTLGAFMDSVEYPDKETADCAVHLIRSLLGYNTTQGKEAARRFNPTPAKLCWLPDDGEARYQAAKKSAQDELYRHSKLPTSLSSLFVSTDPWVKTCVDNWRDVVWALKVAMKYRLEAMPMGVTPEISLKQTRYFYRFMDCEDNTERQDKAQWVAHWAYSLGPLEPEDDTYMNAIRIGYSSYSTTTSGTASIDTYNMVNMVSRDMMLKQMGISPEEVERDMKSAMIRDRQYHEIQSINE